MVAQDGVIEPPAIGGWSKTLGELHRRIGHRFARSEARGRVTRPLYGRAGRMSREFIDDSSPTGWITQRCRRRPAS